jgi:DNA-binding MarR family transcriptional regulator
VVAEPASAAAETAESATVGAVLTVLRMSRVMERIDAGVSPQQYRMLKLVGAGGERSARLAERLAVAKPTLTSTADSLVGAGLVCREAEPGDRRVVRLHLTEAGQAAVARAVEYTGRKDEILASLQLLDESMTERRRARRPAEDTSAGQQ